MKSIMTVKIPAINGIRNIPAMADATETMADNDDRPTGSSILVLILEVISSD
jgi:hypothetical protein